jgi:hypothetical protein
MPTDAASVAHAGEPWPRAQPWSASSWLTTAVPSDSRREVLLAPAPVITPVIARRRTTDGA